MVLPEACGLSRGQSPALGLSRITLVVSRISPVVFGLLLSPGSLFGILSTFTYFAPCLLITFLTCFVIVLIQYFIEIKKIGTISALLIIIPIILTHLFRWGLIRVSLHALLIVSYPLTLIQPDTCTKPRCMVLRFSEGVCVLLSPMNCHNKTKTSLNHNNPGLK